MNLLSKVAPVELSIANMQKAIKKVNCDVKESEVLHPLDNCYSLNLSFVNALNFIYSNGKGSTNEACKASAYGEFVERLQTKNFFIDFYLPNKKHFYDEVICDFEDEYIYPPLKEFYNPNSECEPLDFVDYNSNYFDKIVSLPFKKEGSKEIALIPVNILQNLYVSNGLASGNSMLEAKVQALSEIIERFVKFEVIKNGYSLPEIPLKKYSKFSFYKDIEQLKILGYKVAILDASLSGKYPVTAVSLIDKSGGIFVSFGAHPIFEVALERTVTELMQGRDINALNGFEKPTFNMQEVANSFNLESHFIDSNGKISFNFLSAKKSFEYCDFGYKGSSLEDEYSYLTKIIKQENRDIFIREYNYLGFDSCQIIVPNFSEVYAVDELIYDNKNRPKFLRQKVLNFKDYDPEEILQECEHLSDSIDMQKYLGVIFKNNFTMADFKVQLYLLLGEYDMALSLLEFSENTLNRVLYELITMHQNSLDFSNFKEALYSVFSKDLVKKAVAILEEKEYLIDTSFANEYMQILKLYDNLEVAECEAK